MTVSGYYKINPLISLGVVLGILAAAMILSVLVKPKPELSRAN
jgi:hypothetical protein